MADERIRRDVPPVFVRHPSPVWSLLRAGRDLPSMVAGPGGTRSERKHRRIQRDLEHCQDVSVPARQSHGASAHAASRTARHDGRPLAARNGHRRREVRLTAFAPRTGLPPGVVSTHRVHSLSEGWSLTSAQPGVGGIQNSNRPEHGWKSAVVPGTVAMSAGATDLAAQPRYDELDWWYRCAFTRPQLLRSPTDRVRLRFDGLATLADVWLNGHSILSSCNMFMAHGADITELLAAENELLIAFRSLDTALAQKRPRPRWKTNLVDQQQLRWFRTTLLGRIPGWTPRLHAVGPWRAVWLEYVSSIDLEELDLQPRAERERQLVSIDARIRRLDPRAEIQSADLIVGDAHAALTVEPEGDRYRIRGTAPFDHLPLGGPPTHGGPLPNSRQRFFRPPSPLVAAHAPGASASRLPPCPRYVDGPRERELRSHRLSQHRGGPRRRGYPVSRERRSHFLPRSLLDGSGGGFTDGMAGRTAPTPPP